MMRSVVVKRLLSVGSKSLVANSGSTARDHLANERTFLAFARTGLGFVGAGLGYFYASTEEGRVLEKMHTDNVVRATSLLVGNGVCFLGFATYRYFSVLRSLHDGKFPINRSGLVFLIVSTGISTAGSLTFIVLDRV